MAFNKAAKALAIALPLLSGVTPCRPEIFRYVDGAGRTVFSNMPRQNPPASARAPASAPAASAVRFPRIDVALQRLRDAERRRIIEEELTAEETAEKQAASSGDGKSAGRHAANAGALRRELSSIR